jgi:predicted  nucleic acid-binding Zn-ribbon protein
VRADVREDRQTRAYTDELDHQIRNTEKELRALQSTLDHLNARNVAFRESFQKVRTFIGGMNITVTLVLGQR